MAWTIPITNFNSQASGAYGTGGDLRSQTFDIMTPEAKSAWLNQVNGGAYDQSILDNYINNYITPAIRRTADARVNQARNQYRTPSGYFSASNALAQQRALYDAGESEASMRAQTTMNWAKMKNDAILAALGMSPTQTAVYRPGSGGGYDVSNSGISTPVGARTVSGLDNLSTSNMGWNKPTTTSLSTGGSGNSSGGFEDLGTGPYGLNYNKLYGVLGQKALSGGYPTSSEVSSDWGEESTDSDKIRSTDDPWANYNLTTKFGV